MLCSHIMLMHNIYLHLLFFKLCLFFTLRMNPVCFCFLPNLSVLFVYSLACIFTFVPYIIWLTVVIACLLIACVQSPLTVEFDASKYCTLRRYSDTQPFLHHQPGRVVLRRHLSQSGIDIMLYLNSYQYLSEQNINKICLLQ